MSFQPQTYDEAKGSFKPLRRTAIPKRRTGLTKSLAGTLTRVGPAGKKARRGKKPSTRSIKKKAWKEFSIFIRTRNADAEGFVKCVTCPARKRWQEMQAGHFIAGRLNGNLFDERGCHPQCSLCNIVKHGNGPMYYRFMLATYGEEVIDELLRQNDITKKWYPGELQEIFEKYQALNEANPILDVSSNG